VDLRIELGGLGRALDGVLLGIPRLH
jgi:hypothetical protein